MIDICDIRLVNQINAMFLNADNSFKKQIYLPLAHHPKKSLLQRIEPILFSRIKNYNTYFLEKIMTSRQNCDIL